MPICSRDEIKTDWLNIASSDNALDKTLDRLIATAQIEIEDICGQPIVSQSKTWTAEGTAERLLPTWYTVPMVVSSVRARSAYTDAFAAIAGTASAVSVNGVQYIVNPDNWTALQYEITATLGYATVPRVIQLCACELVLEMYYATAHAPSGSRFGVSAISEGVGGTSMSKTIASMRSRIMPRLQPYRRITL